jgi:hypothetical protein
MPMPKLIIKKVEQYADAAARATEKECYSRWPTMHGEEKARRNR